MDEKVQERIKIASQAIKTLKVELQERDATITEQKDQIEKVSAQRDEMQEKLNRIEKRAEAERIVDALIDKRQVDPLRRDELVEEIEKTSDTEKLEEFSKMLKAGGDIGELVTEGSTTPKTSTDTLLSGIIDAFSKY